MQDGVLVAPEVSVGRTGPVPQEDLVWVTFTPRMLGKYTTDLKFGGKPIPNAHFVQEV